MSMVSDICPDEMAAIAHDTKKISMFKGYATIEGMRQECRGSSVGHGALPLNEDDGHVVTILREPRSRLISSYGDAEHHEGMSVAYWKQLQRKQRYETDEECHHLNKTCAALVNARVYLNEPANHGCAVKTLNGIPCHKENVSLTEAHLKLAKTRLKNFYFVGLQEEWDQSIFIFHYLRGTNVSAYELEKTRKNHNKDLLEGLPFEDVFDTQLYETAQKIFYERFAKLMPLFEPQIHFLKQISNISKKEGVISEDKLQTLRRHHVIPPLGPIFPDHPAATVINHTLTTRRLQKHKKRWFSLFRRSGKRRRNKLVLV